MLNTAIWATILHGVSFQSLGVTITVSDINQKKFTLAHNMGGSVIEIDIWRVVAVTLEKNVAIVVMLTYRVVALSFSSARNMGRAIMIIHIMKGSNLETSYNFAYLFHQSCGAPQPPQPSLFVTYQKTLCSIFSCIVHVFQRRTVLLTTLHCKYLNLYEDLSTQLSSSSTCYKFQYS